MDFECISGVYHFFPRRFSTWDINIRKIVFLSFLFLPDWLLCTSRKLQGCFPWKDSPVHICNRSVFLTFYAYCYITFILVPLCWECGSCFISIYSATDNMIFFSVNSQTITFGKTYKLLPAELEIFLVIIYKKRLTPPLNSIRIHLSSPVSMTGSCFFSHSLHLIPG